MTTTSFSFAASITREQFRAFRDTFRALAAERKLTSTDILLYNLIRGLPADRGFSEIANANKLANGTDKWLGFKQAKDQLYSLAKYRMPAAVERYKPLTAENITDLQKLA